MARIIGLTGIASRKVHCHLLFERKGYPVIDADQVVHDLQAPGALYRVLVDHFGRDPYHQEEAGPRRWVSGSFQILVNETGPIASKAAGLFVRKL